MLGKKNEGSTSRQETVLPACMWVSISGVASGQTLIDKAGPRPEQYDLLAFDLESRKQKGSRRGGLDASKSMKMRL